MSATASPDTDVELIEHLDFGAACAVHVHDQPCNEPADWWIQYRAHCRRDIRELLICQKHYDDAMAGAWIMCRRCRGPFQILRNITRTERLG